MEPWGEERADLRAGIVAAAATNVWVGKDATPARPADFLPDFAGDRRNGPRELTLEESKAAAQRLADGPAGRETLA